MMWLCFKVMITKKEQSQSDCSVALTVTKPLTLKKVM